MLRKKFEADMKRRLAALKRAINFIVIDLDVFHLKSNTGGNPFAMNELVVNKPFNFRSYGMPDGSSFDPSFADDFLADTSGIFQAQGPSAQLTAYQQWFKEQVDAGLIEVAPGTDMDAPWTSPYMESAYRKGVVRGYTDAKGLANVEGPFGQGSKAQFLSSAFSGPIGTRQLQLLATRCFQQLRGVTAAMEQQMSRVLADGLAHGLGPREIARRLNNTVTGLGKNRSLTIARTEIINSFAEGQLDSFDQMNIEEVGVMTEWLTTGDDRVCPLCEDLNGVVLTVKEARGMIPRHPNCRCAWIPAMVGEKGGGRKTTQKQIQASIKKSANRQKNTTWAGADKVIAKDRTKTPGFDARPILKGKPKKSKTIVPDITPPQKPAPGLWDHQPTAVLRWMGQEGFSVDEASFVMRKTGTSVSEATVKTQVRGWQTRGVIAPLTPEQAQALRLLRSGVVPEFPQANTAIIRWMGREGFTFEEAQAALIEAGLEAAESTIKTQLGAGRRGLRGAVADLDESQKKWLLSRRNQPGVSSTPDIKPTAPKPKAKPKPEPKPEPKPDVGVGPRGMNVEGVDASDEFVQKVWKEIGDDGLTSHQQAERIGKMIDEEILRTNPRITELKTEIKRTEDKIEILKQKQWEAKRDLYQWELDNPMPSVDAFGSTDEWRVAFERWQNSPEKLRLMKAEKELWEEVGVLQRRIDGGGWNSMTAGTPDQTMGLVGELNNAYSEATIDTISRIRSVGQADDFKWAKGSNRKAGAATNRASKDLPTDWMEMVQEECEISCKKTNRGYFSSMKHGGEDSSKFYHGVQRHLDGSLSLRDPDGNWTHATRGLKRTDSKHAVRSNLDRRSTRFGTDTVGKQTKCNLRVSVDRSERVSQRSARRAVSEGAENALMDRTGTHELVHAVQFSSGDRMVMLEHEFLASRWIPADKFLPYENGTICLPDEFAHNYSGKVYLWDKDLNQPLANAFKTPDEFLSAVRSGKYEFHNSGEIATMGIEGLIHGDYNMVMDDGYRHFILGLLGGF
tara:strand:+ start:7120 stop:10173 length:3054 start_codon:yes stop_codon:yes gene_type:complete